MAGVAKHVLQDFAGKVAFITGGGSGIGRASADILASRGAAIAVIDIRGSVAEKAADEIQNRVGTRCVGIACDTSVHQQVVAAVRDTVKQLGRLDCAINAAGLPAYIGEGKWMGDYEVEEWKRIIDVNCNGVFYCVREQINHFMETKTMGSIVNLSSIGGKRPLWLGSAYVAAKHAVIGISQSASLEYSRYGIRTNTIAPGFVDTPQLRSAGRAAQEEAEETNPIHRMGKAEEIGELAAFLLSDKASYSTGATHIVDGGWMNAGPGSLHWDEQPEPR